ncbi:hypothetical protein DFP72DRAFT_1143529 [Ephemerocybe angulata]|uniref:ubiquitinyl hydrolase 1 n=1 Tax=Ephemerocybe angulata TaxID=980116 RepID=A0A8H6HLE0_9AGAR|nr:hypothetical protein DFP72DRAFT_1143529 [Tulosesus angulatus]
MESTPFGEHVDRLGNIKSILQNYPFSAGLLRELLQNSDDAKATEQIFLLDCRQHPARKLYNAKLTDTQGPALLAYNNASFTEADWKALQNINKSSKVEDTSKIGKFGVGIRSCYHITDYLQVLSGQHLVIFDPQCSFSADGGVRLSLKPKDIGHARDHLSAFGHLYKDNVKKGNFDGTIVRLPLRTEPGDILENIVSPRDIEGLFKDFIDGELGAAMLFLQHLRSIKLVIVDKHGTVRDLASCAIDKPLEMEDGVTRARVRIKRRGADVTETKEWAILDQAPPLEEAHSLLSKRMAEFLPDEEELQKSLEVVLKKHKLRPDVGIAFPLSEDVDSSPRRNDAGCLFTFLRLPIETGFPVHIHGCFALTTSRQNLRNPVDNGVVKGSEDRVLIEWNKFLFEFFIPRAWAHLLEIFTTQIPSVDIFSVWPASQPSTSGQSVYWQKLPQALLQIVCKKDLAVWPNSALGGEFSTLENVFIAPPTLDQLTVDALAAAEVPICAVPPHVYELGFNECDTLTPKSAAKSLKTHPPFQPSSIASARTPVIYKILEYLLSTGDLNNIVGLQIIPAVSGHYISLRLSSDPKAECTHTLLEPDEYELFRLCDDNAIYIGDLPGSTAKLLKSQGPTQVNVQLLDSNCVVDYLDQHPTRKGVELHSTPPTRDALASSPNFGQVLLLPCLHGLEPTSRKRPVFKRDGSSRNNTALYKYLTRREVPFLADVGKKVEKILETYGLLKSLNDIPSLLDCLERLDAIPLHNDSAAESILQHFDDHMFAGNSASQPYSTDQARTFKELPIFPVVESVVEGGSLLFERNWIALDGFKTVYGVSSLQLLPDLPDTAFLDCKNYFKDEHLLSIINPKKPEPLPTIDIVSLSLNHLPSQPKQLIASILQFAASHRNDLSQNTLSLLRRTPFVLSGGESDVKVAPGTLIDPSSPLSQFYPEDCLPRREDDVDENIVKSLSDLSLMNRDLSPSNVKDCTRLIAANPDEFQPSIRLLNLLYEKSFNFASLNPLDRTLAWLPTQNEELSDAQTCHPSKGQTSKDDVYLFDHVWAKVHSDVKEIPPSLVKALGWDKAIPTKVLITQLCRVLEAKPRDIIRRVTAILVEMGSRAFSSNEQRSLEVVIEGKEWVPVSAGSGERLVHPWQAVLATPFAGVFRVSGNLLRGEGVKRFLKQNGCEESPSFATVERRLVELSKKPVSPANTKAAVAVLKFAVEKFELDDEALGELLVPDVEGELRPIDDVLYNDVGPNSLSYDLGDCTLANAAITEDLAKQLGLKLLGMDSEFTDMPSLGEDMGVSSATIVKKTLGNYNEKQFLPEFLANADDAGATQFEVILYDHTPTPDRAYLSSKLGVLCAGPAVMVCNDSTFSQKDFDGICRTHIGSKENEVDTIGQFGLGALTMFHVTQCAIIYSGDSVLFLDPAKQYLPTSRRAAMLVPLKQILKWVYLYSAFSPGLTVVIFCMRSYPGHIDCVKDMECYNKKKNVVNGTIFYLPLRTSTVDALKGETYTLESFQNTLLEDFKSKANECLLFVKLKRIVASEGNSGKSTKRLWSFEAGHSEEARDDSEVVQRVVTITHAGSSRSRKTTDTRWRTITATIPPDSESIPASFRMKGMPKSIRIGLAAPLDAKRRIEPKLFSTLPLAINIALPVHVNASFIMSSDRRHIRLDTYDNEETKFNRWLLQDAIPQLYLPLLETLAKDQDNARWWPGTLTRRAGQKDAIGPSDSKDPLAGAIIESFYSKHLPESQHSLFRSMFNPPQLYEVSNIVLYPSKPKTPSAVLEVLEWLSPNCLVDLAHVRQHLEKAGVAVCGPPFVKEILLEKGGADRVQLEIEDEELVKLLEYLADPDPSHLHDLPLLQLEDGKWETFGEGPTAAHYYATSSTKFVSEGLFSAYRLVNCKAFPHQLLKGDHEGKIDVEILHTASVRRLIEERLDELSGQALGNWLMVLWKLIPSLPQENLDETIEDLPLVPTTKASQFKSLLEVKNGQALVTSAREEAWLKKCFGDLGIAVVDPTEFPPELQSRLVGEIGGKYVASGTLFDRFVGCVTPILDAAIKRLEKWTGKRQQDFSGWVQKQIISPVPDEGRSTLGKLPLWTAKKGSKIAMRSADDVVLLPQHTPLSVGRFCRRYVTADTKVTHLGNERINLASLYALFELPAVLPAGEAEKVYLNFIRQVLTSNVAVSPLRVPNADRSLVPVSTLYEHSDFYDAAFGTSSSQFLLPSFDVLSNGLALLRDTNESLGHQRFAQCARIFEQQLADTPEYVERARVLYRRYCEGLALAHPLNPSQWHLLDNINFIPRSMNTTVTYLSDAVGLPAAIRQLPSIAAPRNVVRREFHDISWTQLVALEEEPREGVDRIKVVYPRFGRPSANVVLDHLRALAKYPRSPVILHSLRKTYEWLNKEENIEDIEDDLEDMSDVALFLNVDDASGTDEWTWLSANQLALETHDLSEVKAVRKFILPFRSLLKAAGVVEAFYPDVEQEGDDTPASQDSAFLVQMRRQFNEYRHSRNFTDLAIIPDEDQSGGGEQMEDTTEADPPGLYCHRLILAGCSSFFEDAFAGGYKEGQGNATSKRPEKIRVPGSRRAIAAVLDYIYTGKLVPPEDPITVEVLLGCLQLADYLGLKPDSACSNAVVHEIAKRQLLDPHNLDEVRESAKKFNAKRLEQYCDRYEETNEVLIRLARGDHGR